MSEFNENVTGNEFEAEPEGKAGESKAEKFVRLGEFRVNKAITAISRLENLANRGSYEYTPAQVEAMFAVLENRLADVKSKFQASKTKEDNTFSFGSVSEE